MAPQLLNEGSWVRPEIRWLVGHVAVALHGSWRGFWWLVERCSYTPLGFPVGSSNAWPDRTSGGLCDFSCRNAHTGSEGGCARNGAGCRIRVYGGCAGMGRVLGDRRQTRRCGLRSHEYVRQSWRDVDAARYGRVPATMGIMELLFDYCCCLLPFRCCLLDCD